MIEETAGLLLNYGTLGILAAIFIYDKYTFQKEMKEIVKTNNIVVAQNTQILGIVAKKL